MGLKTIGIRDVDLSLEPNPINNDVMRIVDIKALKQSIKNLCFFEDNDIFEQVFQTELAHGLFELGSDYSTNLYLKSVIEDRIRRYEPRVANVNIDVMTTSDESGLEVIITFVPVFDQTEHKLIFTISLF